MSSAVAIIAEYNPFHNGHLYHLSEAKRLSGAEYSFAVMSGNFVQRGEPALQNKLTRAKSAVLNGLDIIFELPVRFSTASAQDFAYAGVEMINSLKAADYLAFGAETNDITKLTAVSKLLANESGSFKASLNDRLKEGCSFPKAKALAVLDELGSDFEEVITLPNNILAIEYLTALLKLDSPIKPVLIQRNAASHDSDSVSGEFASAKMIRNMLYSGNHDEASRYLPSQTEALDEKYIRADDITALLNLSLINFQHTKNIPQPSILDMSEELSNKLRKLTLPLSYEEINEALKTKELTLSRIRRVLIHLLLDIRAVKTPSGIYCPYASLLALRKDSSKLLRAISDNSCIDIINKRADYQPKNQYVATLYEYDKKATDIYNLLYFINTGVRLPNELSSNIVIV